MKHSLNNKHIHNKTSADNTARTHTLPFQNEVENIVEMNCGNIYSDTLQEEDEVAQVTGLRSLSLW